MAKQSTPRSSREPSGEELIEAGLVREELAANTPDQGEAQEILDTPLREFIPEDLSDAASRMEACSAQPVAAQPVVAPTRSRGLGEFRPTKAGTNRAKLLRMAVEGATLKQMAEAIGTGTGNVCTTFSCLRRDCGIDYALDRVNSKVIIFFPEGHDLTTAIR